jgi:hypothetical protein
MLFDTPEVFCLSYATGYELTAYLIHVPLIKEFEHDVKIK